jgi:ABC-type transport system substrate-binding protein
LRENIVNKLKTQLEDFNDQFVTFLESGRDIENGLQNNTELLTEIRKKFDNLSATVELEFEGISVFDQEIKKAKDLLQASIAKVHESAGVSAQINQDLNNISDLFKKIQSEGRQLEETIKNISIVSDSIEVASRNAGITAFHAGKQGRGFEVIAKEMTQLVRSSQEPTQQIPRLTERVILGMDQLDFDLKKIAGIINYLNEIAGKFTAIINELLSIIPTIETGIKGIAESIATQKEMHNLLLRENEKLAQWLDTIYDTARSSVITEIFLEGLFRHINDIKDALISVTDAQNFYYIFRTFQTVVEDATRKEDKISREITTEALDDLETSSSDRLILQFVSEANHLHQTIENIEKEVKNWTKTNALTNEVIARGVNFYQDIVEMLTQLNRNLNGIRDMTLEISEPLEDLKRITERSRVLGLYAGIESARGGEYAGPLGVVTREIKNLSRQTASFVDRIGVIENDILKEFNQLGGHFIKSMSDVEQGIGSLKSAIASFEENRKVLSDLGVLAREMMESTNEMFDQCRNLGEQVKDFNENYGKIGKDYGIYAAAIRESSGISDKILTVIHQHEKGIRIAERKDKVLVCRDATDPILLDPANKTDTTSNAVIEQVCTGLLTFNHGNNMIPAVADSFSASRDGRVWDFIVKKGVTFHDGSPVTAADVVYSIIRAKKGTNANFIDYVDNVLAVADNRVRFFLKYPYIPFLANLACGVCDIIPRGFTPDKPIGCGPFRFLSWEKNKEVILESFEDFYDGRPPLDRVIIRTIPDSNEAVARFNAGEISVMRLQSNQVDQIPPENLVSGPTLSTQYLAINVAQDTPFRNKLVRQAVNLAIDREFLINQMYRNRAIPAYGIFPPGMAVFNRNISDLYAYDLKRARQIMVEAGYPNGLKGAFNLDSRDNDESLIRAEIIKSFLEKIGIEITIQTMSFIDFLEKGYRGEALLQVKGWVSDNGDPDNFLYPLFHTRSHGRAGNTTMYSNPEVDRAIDAARIEPSAKRRNQMYQKIEQTIVEDAAAVFLYHPVEFYAVAKNVGGFKVDPFSMIRFRYLWC